MSQSDQKNHTELKSWLDQIQQDSWQLELIVSGFVIFLMLGGYGPIMDWEYEIDLLTNVDPIYFIFDIFYYTMRTAYQAMLVCLLIHVIMRGLWIAAIGLRYVSGDINYDALKFQPRFTDRLRTKIGRFDDYIERLERYCSVIFSLAFLILFCFASLTSFFIAVTAIQVSIRFLRGQPWTGNGVSLIDQGLGTVLTILGLIYFIDFASLGFFKRNKWVSKPYYYIYRFMGWITLARFYRPLYYNLIDQRFGRRLARLLPVFIIGCLVAVSIQTIRYSYFPYYAKNGEVWIDHYNYDDEREVDLRGQTWRITLNSKYPRNNYVEVFKPYQPINDNEVIKQKFPDLDVSQYTGVKLAGAFNIGQRYNRKANYDSLLIAMQSMQKIYVDDSLRTDIQPRFHYHEKRSQPGLLYMVPTHDFENGEHYVQVKYQDINADTLRWIGQVKVYFYK